MHASTSHGLALHARRKSSKTATTESKVAIERCRKTHCLEEVSLTCNRHREELRSVLGSARVFVTSKLPSLRSSSAGTLVLLYYSPFQVLCPTRNFFPQTFPNCELLSGAGIIRSARTAGFQVSLARAFRRVPVSFKYLPWLQAGQARSEPPYGRHSVFVEGGIPMPQVPSGRQGVASSCRIRLTSTIRSSASS